MNQLGKKGDQPKQGSARVLLIGGQQPLSTADIQAAARIVGPVGAETPAIWPGRDLNKPKGDAESIKSPFDLQAAIDKANAGAGRTNGGFMGGER